MKALVFDTGPIISLTTNNLLWLAAKLKERFGGEFYITESVRTELIDRPFATKKFKFEAFQVQREIERGTFNVVDSLEAKELAKRLERFGNTAFSTPHGAVRMVQFAELESLAFAHLARADAVVTDERITRAMVESPQLVKTILHKRLHMPIRVNKEAVKEFHNVTREIPILRSIELVSIAFEQGLLDEYLVGFPNAKRELLEGLLWGLKLKGASVSETEINQIMSSIMGQRQQRKKKKARSP